MSHQAKDTACEKTRCPVCAMPGTWAAGAGMGRVLVVCQAPGSRPAAAGCARGGHIGGNSLEGETRVEAGTMGGPGYRAQMPL